MEASDERSTTGAAFLLPELMVCRPEPLPCMAYPTKPPTPPAVSAIAAAATTPTTARRHGMPAMRPPDSPVVGGGVGAPKGTCGVAQGCCAYGWVAGSP